VKCAQWKRLPYSWMILNQRRVQSNCGRYVISDVFCTTYKNLVYISCCVYCFYIIFYLCPFWLTGSITLEPLTASKYCTILWIRNGINCFLQLLIYYLCTLGFACFYNASTVPAISEDCLCYLILLSFLGLSLCMFAQIRLTINFTYIWNMFLVDPYINFFKSMDSLVNQQYAATPNRYFQA
jgi:hypothetical protein